MSRHRHTWREVDAGCYWCPVCDAEKFHDEIIQYNTEEASA